MKLLCNYAFKWEEIGTALNFTRGELQNIKHSSPIASPQQHLNQLLDEWAQWPNSGHHEVPTVKRLCDALRSNLVRLGAEANKLHERRYSLPSQLHKLAPVSPGEGTILPALPPHPFIHSRCGWIFAVLAVLVAILMAAILYSTSS